LDGIESLVKLFLFNVEERIECLQSSMVRYTAMPNENTLTLSIPIEKALNSEELKSFEKIKEAELHLKDSEKTPQPKAVVPFEACIEEFLLPESIDNFLSSATNTRGKALKTTRLVNFPPYLVLKLRRYVLGADWTPKKLDAKVLVPERFDFAAFRG
jgi:uncharacterized UBP type Zn finger protein